jgi:hypothetical protein
MLHRMLKCLILLPVYYGQVADLKLGGQDYEDVYKFLIGIYYQKKDDANFKKYLALAKELYPNDNALWTQYEMENMTANSSLTDCCRNTTRKPLPAALMKINYWLCAGFDQMTQHS